MLGIRDALVNVGPLYDLPHSVVDGYAHAVAVDVGKRLHHAVGDRGPGKGASLVGQRRYTRKRTIAP
jgi:hypothetical protein